MIKPLKYVLLVQGKGKGCEQTIGCNKDFRLLDSQTLEEAKQEVLEYLFDHGYEDMEDWSPEQFDNRVRFKGFSLIEVSEVLGFPIGDVSTFQGWIASAKARAIERASGARREA